MRPARAWPALALLWAVVACPAGAAGQERSERGRFSVVEATIPEMQAAMASGRTTAREIVIQSLARIASYDDRLNAAVTVSPSAVARAEDLDAERARGIVRGPLHGIPIALKDIIHTTDLPTTGGALAFEGFVPPYAATLTRRLEEAGAIIIAKTGLTELANWVAEDMPANYDALTGYGMNPYDPRPDPRPETSDGRPVLGTGGSSSGAGTAASFWVANVGTETSGSILSPSNQNMLVGIKPTVGRVSRYGVIPITADQDTPGPMARTVTDAAILLGVLEGTKPDPMDTATGICTPPPGGDYTAFLNQDGLRGARIGIPRDYYYRPVEVPGTTQRGGLGEEQRELMESAIELMRARGALIVDPVELPSIASQDPEANLLLWPICSGLGAKKGLDDDCSVSFKYGMKRDFEGWLASLGEAAPVGSLAELIEWNGAHEQEGAIRYGQAQLEISEEMDVEADRARYEADRARDVELAARRGIDAAVDEHQLDALLFPGSSGAAIAARPGYPTVIVPFGTVPNAPSPPLPSGFDARAAPYGVSFAGVACSEPRLIEIAYAFEQATRARIRPVEFP